LLFLDAHHPKTVPTRVLKDVFHLMDMLPISERHGMHKEFMKRFRDALFVYDHEDRKRITEHLVKTNTTWEETLERKPHWILKRVKRQVPPPNVLCLIVETLFEQYGPLPCETTGLPLFDNECKRIANNILESIRLGHISDLPDVALYHYDGKDANGLNLYRCSRGTNSVEGGVHQNVIRKLGSFNASPMLIDCALADFRLKHNTDVCNSNFIYFI
jgi:hypothetical protein